MGRREQREQEKRERLDKQRARQVKQAIQPDPQREPKSVEPVEPEKVTLQWCFELFDPYDWLSDAQEFDKKGEDDKALRLVYKEVNKWLSAGEFYVCDTLVRGIEVSQYSVDMLLAFLTITLRYHDRLPSRADFFDRVAADLQKRGYEVTSLLDGLG